MRRASFHGRRVTLPEVAPSTFVHNFTRLMGGNLNEATEWTYDRMFANAALDGRGWAVTGTSWTPPAGVDANGDLTSGSASFGLSSAGGALPIGNYTVDFTGGGSISALAGCSYSAPTLTVNDSGNGESGNVSISATAPVLGLTIMRPGLSLSQKNDCNPNFLAHWGQFDAIRFMHAVTTNPVTIPPGTYRVTWTGSGSAGAAVPKTYPAEAGIEASWGAVSGNETAGYCDLTLNGGFAATTGFIQPASGNVWDTLAVTESGEPANKWLTYYWGYPDYWLFMRRERTWAQRVTVGKRLTSARNASELPPEQIVKIANALFAHPGSKCKRMWHSLHQECHTDYLTNYFQYLKDNLTAGVGVDLEHTNEMWIGGTPVNPYHRILAAELVAGGDPYGLNYDGTADIWAQANRLHAYYTRRIGVIAKSIFGAEFGSRVKVWYGAHTGSAVSTGLNVMRYLEDVFGEPANTYIHGMAPACYAQPNNTLGAGATANDLVDACRNDATYGLARRFTQHAQWRNLAAIYGMELGAYEIGIDTDMATAVPLATKLAAHDSAYMGALVTDLMMGMYKRGHSLLHYFHQRGGKLKANVSENYDVWATSWGGTPSDGGTASPKLTALLNVVGAAALTAADIIADDRIGVTGALTGSWWNGTAWVGRDFNDDAVYAANWTAAAPITSIPRYTIVGQANTWRSFWIVAWSDTNQTKTLTPHLSQNAHTRWKLSLNGNVVFDEFLGPQTGFTSTDPAARTAVTGRVKQGWNVLKIEAYVPPGGTACFGDVAYA